MKFSFLTWNVRMYKGSRDRLEMADDLISSLNPDVFGLIEFRAKNEVRELMFDRFPEYDFAVTDSRGGLELVVGCRRGMFQQIIWTQKRDFQIRNQRLRPGGLVSVNSGGDYYNLLFLHTKSGTARDDYEAREEMFKKIWKMRRALGNTTASGKSNLIVLGDLNTMGRHGVKSGAQEIAELAADAGANDMVLVEKDQPNTWHAWGRGPRGNRRKLRLQDLAGAKRSNLDHVLFDKDLDIAGKFPNRDKLHVLGWNQLTGRDRIDFLWELSDHSAIYGRVL